jgi:transcription initiation factor TFIIB
MPLDDSLIYVSNTASKAALSQHTENLATFLLRIAKQAKIDSGKNPRGMAAAALYLAAQITGEPITQKKLAKAAAVTEVTIRNRYQTLLPILPLTKAISPSSITRTN